MTIPEPTPTDPMLQEIIELRKQVQNVAFQIETATLLSYLTLTFRPTKLAEVAKRLRQPPPGEEPS